MKQAGLRLQTDGVLSPAEQGAVVERRVSRVAGRAAGAVHTGDEIRGGQVRAGQGNVRSGQSGTGRREVRSERNREM